jgi:quinone-modifying oxidoreductase subunit QmoC
MPNTTMTKPDLDFIRELKAAGGEDLKKCYQCATCSVVCKLSPDDQPYPRKEMIWAQWGQRDRLVSDPDVWLCHQCNDCSTYCPRGARPGDVLAALRRFSIQHYSVPSFMARIVNNPSYVLLAFAIPVVLILAAHYLVNGQFIWAPQGGHIHFSEFFPHAALNVFFGSLFLLAVVVSVIGASRLWSDLKERRPPPPSAAERGSVIGAMVAAFVELLVHGKFRQCGTAKKRTWSHMLIFYGFAGLFVVTGIVVIMLLIAPDSYPIDTLGHPLKIAGNLFGVLLILGALVAIYNRLTNEEDTGRSSYFDWFFLIVVLMVGVTGMATQYTRFAHHDALAYPTYFIHLVFTFALLIYLPYSKFAHLVYRFTAITYAKHVGLLAGDAAAVAAHGRDALTQPAPEGAAEEPGEKDEKDESGEKEKKEED